MDYELRIIVEKVAVSSQEVIKRDTITSYALQCPTTIVELGLRHAEQIALLEKIQNRVLAEQSRLLAPGMPGCPTCGNTLDIIANNPIAQKVVELSSSQPYSLVEHSLYRFVFNEPVKG